MDELIDMIAMDKSPSEVTDKIKDVLYGKAAERIDALKPDIAQQMFDPTVDEVEDEVSDVVLKPDIASQMFDATTDDEVSDEPVDSMDDSTEEEEEEEEI